ncbi:APC family permease [Anaerotignum lactatifermentans]|uniref:APC family permease n=1 Tax=Anaerotignum lactatifermentans TaxID=160404 RepID=A0ABS2G8J9_9FIRM|nr:APC family permease [Anaerotignum lactatifermentans]MBM6829436.1 APC family permease [Anaerotignum lactatifermentans]MBM6877794.1 APC family permease [Anaerotignum lactatifermentans]MBM6951013.1 APC family permease [Anaerotignum lactatifermentans]
MQNGLEKKYGLLTAIAMVVGIVIGSGVFFKAEKVLVATGGDLPLGILSWFLGGLVMIVCAYNFAVMATRYEKVSGVVDYAEVMVGRKYGYYFAWFMATIYFPAMTSVVAWVAARYTAVLMGWDIAGPQAMNLAALYLVGSFTLNAVSPKLAGKFQITTTAAKLIPLGLMAVVGTIYGLKNGVMIQNFTSGAIVEVSGNPLFTAVVGTCFAYEGWICATSINAELKDAKKNLPRALVFGSIFVVLVYMLYYVGLAGAVENEIIMAGGETGAKIAFSTVFTEVGGTLLFVFVVISCLGTLNGLMLACTRGFYAMASRKEGPAPEIFNGVDKATNMPTNSAVMGLFMAAVWLTYFYGANLTDPWFGPFCFDSSELPIITIYLMYIPIFVMQMVKEKELPTFKRVIMPILGVAASLFMVVAAIVSLRTAIIFYLILFAAVMIVGACLKNYRNQS